MAPEITFQKSRISVKGLFKNLVLLFWPNFYAVCGMGEFALQLSNTNLIFLDFGCIENFRTLGQLLLEGKFMIWKMKERTKNENNPNLLGQSCANLRSTGVN